MDQVPVVCIDVSCVGRCKYTAPFYTGHLHAYVYLHKY